MPIVAVSVRERIYLARAVDVARSDEYAAAILSPTERDDLLRRLGGRDQTLLDGSDPAENGWRKA